MNKSQQNTSNKSLVEQSEISKEIRKLAGRKRAITKPEQLTQALEEYALICKRLERPLTITGYLNHLGVHRTTFDRTAEREGFGDVCKLVMQYIESGYEQCLTLLRNPTGAIFALKNLGWKDTQHVEIDTIMTSLNRIVTVAISYIPEENKEAALQEMRQCIKEDTFR